ncbi:MAG: protein kinase [Planctomycetes bacterium]|nr:protein kinase [Planctomycetota bacterium]
MSLAPMPVDPILAMLPVFLGRPVLHPCVLYARLGRGGMGAVYLAKHLTLRQRQVVKFLWQLGHGHGVDDGFVERFQQEARIAAEMTHQNLVRVTHVDRIGELHYLVMDYIEGEDAQRRIQRGGAMNEAAALALVHGAAAGLGYAHGRGIVHRDVKPANLMISVRGEVKVIDLGLARATGTGHDLTATAGMLGTPRYMAPEQWDSTRVGPQADVWSLGATLWYLLAGRSHVPEDVQTPSAIRGFIHDRPFPELPALPAPVRDATRQILRRCLARDPDDRYADGRELAAAIASAGVEDGVLADPAGVAAVPGEEPNDAELAAIQQQLAAVNDGRGGARHGRPVDDLTVLAPGNVDPRTPTPVALPPKAGRRSLPAVAAIVVTAIVLASSGVIWLRRVDPVALQNDAMAAIYQERFADAAALLVRLCEFPAHADQARRLRVDALVKEANRLDRQQQQAAALAALRTAADVSQQLLIPRDRDDAVAQVAEARQRVENAVRQQLAAGSVVIEPAPDASIGSSRVPLLARFDGQGREVNVTVDGVALTGGSAGTRRGLWRVPSQDGAHTVAFVFEDQATGVRHVVQVPVQVKLADVTLQLEALPERTRAGALELRGNVQNGPTDLVLELIAPDGRPTRHELGPQAGAVTATATFPEGVDGDWMVRLRTRVKDQDVVSNEAQVRVDRQPPTLTFAADSPRGGGAALLLRGRADEAGRVHLVGRPDEFVTTDGKLEFTITVPLPAAEGSFVVELVGQDLAGNAGQPQPVAIAVDHTAPTFVAGSIACERAVAGARVTIQGRLDEAGSVRVGDLDAVATSGDGTFAVVAELPPGSIEQSVPLRLLAYDLAGNAGAPQPVTVLVDRKGPAILPGAGDGSWWASGSWNLLLEDGSQPCRVTVGDETRTTNAQGRVEFAVRADLPAIEIRAQDALGNTSTRRLHLPRAPVADGPATPAGPTWGTPAVGSAVDPDTRLHERVVVPIGRQSMVLRLVRSLREHELPPPAQRDAKAVALLQGRGPFYLSETEVTVAQYGEFVARRGEPPTRTDRFVFDPTTGRSAPTAGADWRTPLHPGLLAAAPSEVRERWPVTQVTPDEARAFCREFELRLPNETEWAHVARMGCRARYGYLAGGLEGMVNLADQSLKDLAPGLLAFETFSDGHPGLAPVDAFPRTGRAHPWGFAGLLGNAAEWCTTERDRVVARGGCWLSEPRELRVDDVRQDGAITAGSWDRVGFRVARDP